MSKLEEEMLFAIRAVGLPDPVREMHPFWCCEHRKRAHLHSAGEPDLCVDCAVASDDEDVPLHSYRHGRAFRFDLCWPTQMLAVELDGATWTGGRHTRGNGFQSDAEKRNLAQMLGWRVLTFTRRDVTSGLALATIESALKAATKDKQSPDTEPLTADR